MFNIFFLLLFTRFWDDWIRQPAQRRERACIRPEISRTKTFGKVGVSKYVFSPFFKFQLIHFLFLTFFRQINSVMTLILVVKFRR